MRQRPTVEAWRRAVFASRMPDRVKLLLILMADHMRADLYVSIPRSTLAQALGVHEQRVSERIKTAIDSHYLASVSPGYRGHTAVYRAQWPDRDSGESVRPTSKHSTPRNPDAIPGDCLPDGSDAISRANPLTSGAGGDGGTYEEVQS